MPMTSEAKAKLRKTIRGTENGKDTGLRGMLLLALREAADREYQLDIPRIQNTNINEERRCRRQRLEAWLDQQVRAESGKQKRSKEQFLDQVVRQAAYTLLNRLVLLRILEASGLRKPFVVTGGWNSPGYKEFRDYATSLCRHPGDPTEGYAFLLRLIFEDFATDLPGLFGSAGIADLIPVPASALRRIVEAFDDPEIESCWTDDMTLGWVYQYWNDPDREALDEKINDGGKIEPHEIASKTQMFTERYMVDWLLQNSLGPMWLAMCRKHGWTPEVESLGVLDELERRRVEWRAKRDAGEVSLTELMPLHSDMERRWAYYVPQPIPADAVASAPDSVRDLKILDPAVGSGHFLVVAFDLLLALYEEEDRHRRAGSHRPTETTDAGTDRPVGTGPTVSHILEHNLHGIDLDPRAVQIAAAALWLKAQTVAFREAKEAGVAFAERKPVIRQLNLVASNLRLGSLPHHDPALVELRQSVERESGIPATLTDSIVQALAGADHLGSLLKVDAAIDAAIDEFERSLGWETWGDRVKQLNLFPDGRTEQREFQFSRERVERGLLLALEEFLSRHTSAQELGLRLHGEQLAAGVRFVRLVREGSYDLIVANPPYQGTSKMAASKYVEQHYRLGKADLFAAFLLRGLELVRPGGVSAMLTMRNWMFIKQYSELRQHLLGEYDLRALGDFEVGAFEEVGGMVVSVCVSVFRRVDHRGLSIAQKLTLDADQSSSARTSRKRAATLCHEGRHHFDPAALQVVPEWPLVYWWDEEMLRAYHELPLLGDVASIRSGMQTADNARFVRRPFEALKSDIALHRHCDSGCLPVPVWTTWVPYIQGAQGRRWLDPCVGILKWKPHNLGVKVLSEIRIGATIRNEEYFFQKGIAFTPIGASLTARSHRFASVCDTMGSSLFGDSPNQMLGLLNRNWTNALVCGLNPTVHFQVGDLVRIPFRPDPNADEIFAQVESAFGVHESHREASVEFQQPGPSPWRAVQLWAQRAVDRPEGEPLPDYVEELDPEPPTDHLSFALGVALGRFGANGEGILDPVSGRPPSADQPERVSVRFGTPAAGDGSQTTEPGANALRLMDADGSMQNDALPHGILFLDGTLDAHDLRDSLGHPAAQILHDKWAQFGPDIAPRRRGSETSLRDWLREKFFADVHKGMYENRPIHWPLSSAKKTFVAWVTIHRWTPQTLRILLADHLAPTLTRLDGELDDLRKARDGADQKAARDAAARFADVQAWRRELNEFLQQVEACADHGPPPTSPDPKKCPPREVDAPYAPDLDDGVMINSAALWPLLEPQWKDPKKWWTELALSQSKADYDWAHLAMRYWPTRVDAKCRKDPSLGVAHGCFWKYHPARAWAWELRLQDEIAPEFRIEEAAYRPFSPAGGEGARRADEDAHETDVELRAAFLAEHPDEAVEAVDKEVRRRMRKHEKPLTEMRLLEPGLWSTRPSQFYELELSIIEKQGQDFRVIAPDEPWSRAAYEATHPDQVQHRKSLLEETKEKLLFADAEPRKKRKKATKKKAAKKKAASEAEGANE